MGKLVKLLFVMAVLFSASVGCKKKKECDYDGHKVKRNSEYGCHYTVAGDVVTVDDGYCDCD